MTSNGRDSLSSRDQLLSDRRRRRIKSLNSQSADEGSAFMEGETLRTTTVVVVQSSVSDDRVLHSTVSQIKANSRMRSLSLNTTPARTPVSTTTITGPIQLLTERNTPPTNAPFVQPTQHTEKTLSLKDDLELYEEDLYTTAIPGTPKRSDLSNITPTNTSNDKKEALKNLEIKYQQLVYKALSTLSQSQNDEPVVESLPEPATLLDRFDEGSPKEQSFIFTSGSLRKKKGKRETRSYSLPPKIATGGYGSHKGLDSLLKKLQINEEATPGATPSTPPIPIRSNVRKASQLGSHSMPKLNSFQSIMQKKHHGVFGSPLANNVSPYLNQEAQDSRTKQRSRRFVAFEDSDEDEIRNLNISVDPHLIALSYERCPAPDPISMLVGDYPLDRTTANPSHHTISNSVTVSTPTISPLGASPVNSPPKFIPFSNQPPMGLMVVPGIPSSIPKIAIPDNVAVPVNSPRSPDRSKYNVNIVSPRSAFSPHTPFSSPRYSVVM